LQWVHGPEQDVDVGIWIDT
ncbi:hypothetical protein P4O66_006275, partial [Electrophorus voltai]